MMTEPIIMNAKLQFSNSRPNKKKTPIGFYFFVRRYCSATVAAVGIEIVQLLINKTDDR